ncbi:hypothetical protein ACFLRF_01350 [Candidatus Altiarchaeota archaeon]
MPEAVRPIISGAFDFTDLPDIIPNRVRVSSLTEAQKRYVVVWGGGLDNFFDSRRGDEAMVDDDQMGVLRRVRLFDTLGLKKGDSVIEVGAGGDWHTAAIASCQGADYRNFHLDHRPTTFDSIFLPDFPRMKLLHPSLGSVASEYADFAARPGSMYAPEKPVEQGSADFVALFNVLDEASGDATQPKAITRLTDASFKALKTGGFLILSTMDIASHDRILGVIEGRLASKKQAYTKMWDGRLDRIHYHTTVYRKDA